MLDKLSLNFLSRPLLIALTFPPEMHLQVVLVSNRFYHFFGFKSKKVAKNMGAVFFQQSRPNNSHSEKIY
jgi:hypothetical protein